MVDDVWLCSVVDAVVIPGDDAGCCVVFWYLPLVLCDLSC